MKYYLIATGVTFGLLFLGHLARAYTEGSWVFGEPIFLFTTFMSIAFVVWSLVLLKKLRQV